MRNGVRPFVTWHLATALTVAHSIESQTELPIMVGLGLLVSKDLRHFNDPSRLAFASSWLVLPSGSPLAGGRCKKIEYEQRSWRIRDSLQRLNGSAKESDTPVRPGLLGWLTQS